MSPADFVRTHAELVEEFNRRENRSEGAQIASSLAGAFDVLVTSLIVRVHDDVQQFVGRDSMLMPVSDEKMRKISRREIEIFQVSEATVIATSRGYIHTPDDWFLRWLSRVRLPESYSDPQVSGRLADYITVTAEQRRRGFMNTIAWAARESRRAPLVLFRLFPMAVEITAHLAFGHPREAEAIRQQQQEVLPAIRDCRACHGKLLENGQQCAECGNPLWTFKWLTMTD